MFFATIWLLVIRMNYVQVRMEQVARRYIVVFNRNSYATGVRLRIMASSTNHYEMNELHLIVDMIFTVRMETV